MATVIVSVMLTAALSAAGASRRAQQRAADRSQGVMLAQSLMGEILSKPYSDPSGALTLGPDLAEALGPRSGFNDVDDYANYNESPVKNADGTTVPGLSGWSRKADVVWINASDLQTTSLTETNMKRITVTVSRGGVTAATLTAFRAKARDSL